MLFTENLIELLPHLNNSMGRLFLELLDDDYVYSCKLCRNFLTTQTSYKSDAFQGSSGKAILFTSVSNIICSPVEEKQMTTGTHIVRDVFCKLCQSRLGWVYEMAYPPEQRYKEGNYILEQNLIERHQGLCPTETKEKDGSSSPSNTVYNPARYETTHYAISNSRHSFASEPFADFSRFLNRAVVLNNYNEFNQRVQSRHSARLRRAHLPS